MEERLPKGYRTDFERIGCVLPGLATPCIGLG